MPKTLQKLIPRDYDDFGDLAIQNWKNHHIGEYRYRILEFISALLR